MVVGDALRNTTEQQVDWSAIATQQPVTLAAVYGTSTCRHSLICFSLCPASCYRETCIMCGAECLIYVC
jgi:hypothetical protein